MNVIKYLPFLLILLGLIIRLPEISRPFWADEQISINTLNINVINNPFYKGITTNLPLYFWAISLLNYVFRSTNIASLRLFGIGINLLNAWILYRWVKNSLGRMSGLVFLAIFLFAPLQIHYSAELRPYVLSQFFASLLFILVHDALVGKKIVNMKTLVSINLVSILGLLTHYSFYIFYLSMCLYAILKIKKLRIVFKISFLPVVVGLLVAYAYFSNPLFNESLQSLELRNVSVSPISRLLSVESLNRVKEVLSNYYYYGLYYYRLDFWAQFIFKKLFLALILLSSWLILGTRRPAVKDVGLMSLLILLISLIVSLAGEKLGYYPFGGRHIMLFSFLLYLVISTGLGEISRSLKYGKLVAIFVVVSIIFSFTLFQSCSQIFRSRYTGTGDPQGDIYGYCIGALTR